MALTPTPGHISNKRMKRSTNESFSLQKKIVTPHPVTEYTPNLSTPKKLGNEIEYTVTDYVPSEPMKRLVHAIHFQKCPSLTIPDLDEISISEEDPAMIYNYKHCQRSQKPRGYSYKKRIQ